MLALLEGISSIFWLMNARSLVQARYRRLGPWAGFPEGLTSTYMLDPSDPLFTDIGAAFVQACPPSKRTNSLLEHCDNLVA
jgi:hypothetical protein